MRAPSIGENTLYYSFTSSQNGFFCSANSFSLGYTSSLSNPPSPVHTAPQATIYCWRRFSCLVKRRRCSFSPPHFHRLNQSQKEVNTIAIKVTYHSICSPFSPHLLLIDGEWNRIGLNRFFPMLLGSIGVVVSSACSKPFSMYLRDIRFCSSLGWSNLFLFCQKRLGSLSSMQMERFPSLDIYSIQYVGIAVYLPRRSPGWFLLETRLWLTF